MPDIDAELLAAGIELPAGQTITLPEFRFAQSFAQTGQLSPALQAAGWKTAPYDIAGRKAVQFVIGVLERRRESSQGEVADAAERKRLLTAIARGGSPESEMPPSFADRMKAIELLGKMEGDFTEKQEISHISYVVPLPPQIKSVEEWAVVAKETMAALEHKP
jgi:hypothetical protein